MPTLTLRARFVFPVDQPPIQDGYVTFDDARITRVGQAADLPTAEARDPATVDLGSAALLPGFINAHTHLELSNVEAPLGRPAQPFPDWLATVIDERRGDSYDRDAAVQAGLSESLRHGVTGLADIAQDETPHAIPKRTPIPVVAFRELIALSTEMIEARRAEAEKFLASATTNTAEPGLSPHAPYSVHPQLLEASAAIARQHGAPLAMHLAESPEEIELLAHGAGPFRQFLSARGLWQDGIFGNRKPLDVLNQLVKAPRALIVHGNFLGPEEAEFCAAHADRLTVVYCPRTHTYFGHPPHPVAKLLSLGANVAVGTDSKASNPDLNVLAELRHVARHVPGVAEDDLLSLGTLRAARALGWEKRCGAISVGREASFAVVPIPVDRDGNAHELLFDTDQPVTITIIRGQLRYGTYPQ